LGLLCLLNRPCSGLTTVVIQASVKFQDCSRHAQVTMRVYRVFEDSSGLTKVEIPASIKKVGIQGL
jgi:hypothetical protein